MAVGFGNSTYSPFLKLCFDANHTKSWSGSTFVDLITGNDANNIGNPDWLNNISFMTISVVLEWYAPATGYADHPISKFNSTLQNASMTLYHFQNYQNNGADGYWAFIAGNGGWTGLGNGGQLTYQARHHIALQFNMNTGSQTWFNGSKNGGRGVGGILGNSRVAGTGAIGFSGANPTGNGHTRMHHLSMWNSELPDDEIQRQYNMLKQRYGVV